MCNNKSCVVNEVEIRISITKYTIYYVNTHSYLCIYIKFALEY